MDGLSKRRKSSVHTGPESPIGTQSGLFHRQRHPSNSSPGHPFIVVGGTALRNEPAISSSTAQTGADAFEDRNQFVNDAMGVWTQPAGEQDQDVSPSTLLDNISIELPSLGFDALLSNFEDSDFRYIDDSQFDLIETPSDLTYAQAPVFDHPSPQIPAFQQLEHHQPRQDAYSKQAYQSPLSSTPTPNEPTSDSGGQVISKEPSCSTSDVSFWAAQLEELSRRPQTSPIPLDEMLHHSSQLFPRVAEALQKTPPPADEPPSSTNLILILVCLTQTVDLFERCVPPLLSSAAGAAGTPNDLSLRLGAYQVDRKVQQALQVHVVAGELSKVLGLCGLVRRALSRPGWPAAAAGLGRAHSLLLEDLQARTRALAYQMKQKWVSARRHAL